MMMHKRWTKLMGDLGLANNQATYDRLLTFYTQKQRHYHNIKHIQATLIHLDEVWHLAECPQLIALALWFHDAIYKPFSTNNEADSAQCAVDFLQGEQFNTANIDQVKALIMITKHDAAPLGNDQQLMVDIDLGIFASPVEIYQQYEIHVRKEYKWVPTFIYKKQRSQLLNLFLDREQIYTHPYFQKKWTAQARSNLQTAVDQLTS